MRRLVGPSIVLAVAIAAGAAIGWALAPVQTAPLLPTAPPRVPAYSVVDGPTLATQIAATAQAQDAAAGVSVRVVQDVSPGSLGICVHNASGEPLDAGEIGARVAVAHNEALTPPGPTTAGVDDVRIHGGGQIMAPCPADPPLLAPGVTGVRDRFIEGGPSPFTSYASQLRYFIYVVPDAAIRTHLQDRAIERRKFVQERQCVLDVCTDFSYAYYLSLSEFRNPESLTALMAEAFNGFRIPHAQASASVPSRLTTPIPRTPSAP